MNKNYLQELNKRLKEANAQYSQAMKRDNWKVANDWLNEILGLVSEIQNVADKEITKQQRGNK